MSGSSRWPLSRRVRAVIALNLGLVGVGLLLFAVSGTGAPGTVTAVPPRDHRGAMVAPSPSPPPPASSPTVAVDRSGVRDRTTGRVLPESDPVTVSIPGIGVRSRLVDLGLDADGAMDVPRDPSLAGWFSRSAAPGALGPAVIAGHVTWDGAPAVFHRLGSLRRGDAVAVTREDGRTAVFTVSRVARFSKSQFPSRAVYGSIDHAGLRLITCGGTYDTVEHRYLDNIVVFAKLVEVRGPRG